MLTTFILVHVKFDTKLNTRRGFSSFVLPKCLLRLVPDRWQDRLWPRRPQSSKDTHDGPPIVLSVAGDGAELVIGLMEPVHGRLVLVRSNVHFKFASLLPSPAFHSRSFRVRVTSPRLEVATHEIHEDSRVTAAGLVVTLAARETRIDPLPPLRNRSLGLAVEILGKVGPVRPPARRPSFPARHLWP